MIEKLYSFYLNNYQIIDSFLENNSSQKAKKELIKKLYDIIYQPIIDYNRSNISVFRGISATSEEILDEYIKSYENGEMYFGSKASIFGTGMYTCCARDSKTILDYASNGNTNIYGAIIEFEVNSNSKIINYNRLQDYQNELIDILKNKSKNKDYQSYINLLEDSGLFASILGYDAIYVEEKNYMIILNRNKIRVKNIDCLKMNNLNIR